MTEIGSLLQADEYKTCSGIFFYTLNQLQVYQQVAVTSSTNNLLPKNMWKQNLL